MVPIWRFHLEILIQGAPCLSESVEAKPPWSGTPPPHSPSSSLKINFSEACRSGQGLSEICKPPSVFSQRDMSSPTPGIFLEQCFRTINN